MQTQHAIGNLFAKLDREVWIVTSSDGKDRGGLIATAFETASIVPEMPRVLIGIGKQHFTYDLIEASGRFAAHLITEAQIDYAWKFGTSSGHNIHKFTDIDASESKLGNPLLPESIGWLDCRVEAKLDSGERVWYLAEVVDGQMNSDEKPLTVHRLFQDAPNDKLTALGAQLQKDVAIDTEAIRRWREGNV